MNCAIFIINYIALQDEALLDMEERKLPMQEDQHLPCTLKWTRQSTQLGPSMHHLGLLRKQPTQLGPFMRHPGLLGPSMHHPSLLRKQSTQLGPSLLTQVHSPATQVSRSPTRVHSLPTQVPSPHLPTQVPSPQPPLARGEKPSG